MFIVTMTYPNQPGATFDHDYFRQTHLPMLGRAFQPHGMGYASVLKGVSAIDGSPAPFLVYGVFSFATEDGARAAVASAEGRALDDDRANFTNVTPIVQFNEAVP